MKNARAHRIIDKRVCASAKVHIANHGSRTNRTIFGWYREVMVDEGSFRVVTLKASQLRTKIAKKSCLLCNRRGFRQGSVLLRSSQSYVHLSCIERMYMQSNRLSSRCYQEVSEERYNRGKSPKLDGTTTYYIEKSLPLELPTFRVRYWMEKYPTHLYADGRHAQPSRGDEFHGNKQKDATEIWAERVRKQEALEREIKRYEKSK